MLRCSRTQRGTTLTELLTVIVILSLLMTTVAALMSPLLHAQNRSQAKLDTVQSAAAVLYRIQRDLRQTSYANAWACTTGVGASCSRPATFGTTAAVAFPTAYRTGGGSFQILSSGPNIGQPNWQGVMVYWVDPSGNLHWAFDQPAARSWPGDASVSAGTAAQAVADATTGAVPGTRLAANIQKLVLAFDPTLVNIVSLEMQAQSTENGAVNETTYRSDVLARQ